MRYLLDTNILLHYIRESPLSDKITADFRPFGPENLPLLCVVSVGEIRSLARQNYWGAKKWAQMKKLIDSMTVLDIGNETVLDRYSEIDTFSQGKLPNLPLAMTSRNMGKNDLWIAAAASVAQAKLLTTDSDFDHLHGKFLDLLRF